jgi:hypothetical protein
MLVRHRIKGMVGSVKTTGGVRKEFRNRWRVPEAARDPTLMIFANGQVLGRGSADKRKVVRPASERFHGRAERSGCRVSLQTLNACPSDCSERKHRRFVQAVRRTVPDIKDEVAFNAQKLDWRSRQLSEVTQNWQHIRIVIGRRNGCCSFGVCNGGDPRAPFGPMYPRYLA